MHVSAIQKGTLKQLKHKAKVCKYSHLINSGTGTLKALLGQNLQ